MEGVRWRSVMPLLGVLMLWYCTSAMAAPLAWDDSQPTGCFHMMQHYGEGDQILTNEPCLNCTCTNNMFMCFLKVCPYVKPVNKGCSLEKRPGDCCPTVTCQQVPVPIMQMLGMLNASVSTTSIPRPVQLEEPSADLNQGGAGCEVDGQYFRDGAQVPNDPAEPCDVCYCIRNHTACVQQECTMHVPGCRPIFQTGVCCPVRYVCDYETTTLAPTTTTAQPEVAATGCVSNGINYDDGDAMPSEDPCTHCYCMHSEVKCAVQSCASLLDNVHPNCKPEPPRVGQCCPDQYNCDGNGTLESSVGHTELTGPATIVDMLEGSAPGAEALVGTTQASTDEGSQGTPQSSSSQPEITHVSNIDEATVSSSQVEGGESVGHSSISSESTSTQETVTEDIHADTEDGLTQEPTTGSVGIQVEVSTTSGEQGSIDSTTANPDLDLVTDGSYESSGDDVSEDDEVEFSGSVETESQEADDDEQVLIEDISDTDATNDDTTDEETSGDSSLLSDNDEYVVEESSGEAADEDNEGLAIGAELAESIDEGSGDEVEETIDSHYEDGAAVEESVVDVSGEDGASGGDDTFPVTDSDVVEIESSEDDEVDASGDEPTIAISPIQISSTETTADEVDQVSPVVDEIAVVATIDSTQDLSDTLEEEIEGEGSGDNVDEVTSVDPTVEEVTIISITESTQVPFDILNEGPAEIEGSGDNSVNGVTSVDPTVDELVIVATTSSTEDISDTFEDGLELEGSGDNGEINEVAPVDASVDEVAPVDPSVEEVAPVDPSVDQVAPVDPSVDQVAPVDPSVDEVAPVDPSVDEVAPVDPSVEEVAPVDPSVGEVAPVDPSVGEVAPVDPSVDEVAPVDPSVEEVAPVDPSVGEVAPVDPSVDEVAPVDPSVGEVAPVDTSVGEVTASVTTESTQDSIETIGEESLEVDASGDDAFTTDVLADGLSASESSGDVLPAEDTADIEVSEVETPDAITGVDSIITVEQTNSDADSILEFSGDEELADGLDGEDVQVGDGSGENALLVDVQTVDATSMETSGDDVGDELAAIFPDEDGLDGNESSGEESVEGASPSDGAVSTVEIPVESLESGAHSLEDSQISPDEGSGEESNVGELDAITDDGAIEIDSEGSGAEVEGTLGGSEELDEVVVTVPLEDGTASANPEGESIETVESSGYVTEYEITDLDMTENDISVTEGSGQPGTAIIEDTIEQSGDTEDTAEDTSSLTDGMIDSTGELPAAVDVPAEMMTNTESQDQNELSPDDASTSSPTSEEVEDIYETNGISEEAADSEVEGSVEVSTGIYTDSDHLSSDMETSGDVPMLDENEEHPDESQKPLIIDLPTNEEESGQDDQENEQIEMSGEEPVLDEVDEIINQDETSVETSGDMIEQESDQILIEPSSQSESNTPLQTTTGVVVEGTLEEASGETASDTSNTLGDEEDSILPGTIVEEIVEASGDLVPTEHEQESGDIIDAVVESSGDSSIPDYADSILNIGEESTETSGDETEFDAVEDTTAGDTDSILEFSGDIIEVNQIDEVLSEDDSSGILETSGDGATMHGLETTVPVTEHEESTVEDGVNEAESSGDDSVESIVIDQIEDDRLEGSAGIFGTSQTEEEITLEESGDSSEEYQPSGELSALGSSTQTQPTDDAEEDPVEMTGTLSEPDGVNGAAADGTDDDTIESSGDEVSAIGTTINTTDDDEIYQTEASGDVVVLDGSEEVEGTLETTDGLVAIDITQEALEDADLFQIAEGSGSTAAGEPTDGVIDSEVESSGEIPVIDTEDQISFINTDNDNTEVSGGLSAGEESSGDSSMAGENNESISFDGDAGVEVESSGYFPGTEDAAGEQFSTVTDANELETDSLVSTHEEPTTSDTASQIDFVPVTAEEEEDDVEMSGNVPEEINLTGVDNIEAVTVGGTSDVSSAAEITTEASVPEIDVGLTLTDDAASSDETSANGGEDSIEASDDFTDADSNEVFTTEGHSSSAESSGIAIEVIDSVISQQENVAGEIESSGDMQTVGETVGLGESAELPSEDTATDNENNDDLSSTEGGLFVDSSEADTVLLPDEETDVQEDGESSGDPVQSDGSGSDNFIDLTNSVENETVLEASGDGFSDETTESGSDSSLNEGPDQNIPAESENITVNVDEVTSDEASDPVEGNIQEIPDSSGFESDTTVDSIESDGQLTGSLEELTSDGSGIYEPETDGEESEGVSIEDVHEGSAAEIDQPSEASTSIIDGSGYDESDDETNLDNTHISVMEIDSSIEELSSVETDVVESSGMESDVSDTGSEFSGDIAEDSFTEESQVLSESETADAVSNEAGTLDVDVIPFEDGNIGTSESSGNLPDYNIEASGDEELISEDGSGIPVEMTEIEGLTDALSEETDVATQSPDETTTSLLIPGESSSQAGQNQDAESDKGKEDGGDVTSSGTLQTIVEVLNGVLGGPSTAESQQSNSEQNEITTSDSTSSSASNVSSESVTTLEGACTVEGVPYANGSEVPKSDKCQVRCFCSDSVVQCETMHCSGPPADNCRPFYPTDSCCPAYDCKSPDEVSTDSMGCTVGYYKYENGDVVNHHDPCSYCLCIAGEVVCASQVCQTPPQLVGLPCSPLPTKSYECCPTSYACETNDATLAAQTVIQSDVTQNITIIITPNEKPSGTDLPATEEEDKADEEHHTDGATAEGPALVVDSDTMTEQQTSTPTNSENTETSETIAVDVSAETDDTEGTSSAQGGASTGEQQQEQSLSQSQETNGGSSNGGTDSTSTIIVQGTTVGEGETDTNTESLEQGEATQTETTSHHTSTSSSGIEYLPGHTVTETTVITTEQELQPNSDGSGLGNVVTINYITYIIEDTDADGETSIVSSESRTSSSQRPATMPDIVIFQTPQLPKSKVVIVTTVIDSEGNRQVTSSSDNVVPSHISPLVSTSELTTGVDTDNHSSTNTDEAETASVDTAVDAAGLDNSNDQVSGITTASEGATSGANSTTEDEQDLYLPGNSVTETTITSVKESLKPSQDSSDLGVIETYTVITTIIEVIDSTGAKRIIKRKTVTNGERPAQPSDIYTFSEPKPAEVTSLILITVIDDQGKRTSASSTIFGVPSSLTGLVSADGTLLDETEQPTGSSEGAGQTTSTEQQTSGGASSVETGITSGQSQQTVEVSSGNEQASSVQSIIISPGSTVTETTITTVEETLQPGSTPGDYGTIFSTTTTTVITEVQNAAGAKDTTAKTTISKAERTAQSWEVPIYTEGSTTSTVTTVVTTQMNENGEETVITSTPDNIPASLAHLHPPTASSSSGKPSSAVYLPGSTITKTTYTTIKRTLEPGTELEDLGLILTTTNVTLVTEETDASGKTKTTTKTTIAKGRRLAAASDIPNYQVPPAASTTVKKVVYVIQENGQVSSTTTVDGVPLESASQEAETTTVDDVLLENASQEAETTTVDDVLLENVSQEAETATTEASVTEAAESSSSGSSQQIAYQPGQTVTETTTTLVEQTLLAGGAAANNGLLVTTTTVTKEVTVTDSDGGNRTVTTTTVTKSTRPASMTNLLAGAGPSTTSVISVITVLNEDGTNSTSVFQDGVQQVDASTAVVDAESDMISVTDDVLEMLNTVDPEDFANTTDITDEEVSEQQQQLIATTEEPATTSSADGDSSSGSNSSSTTTTTTTTQVFLGPGACLFDGKVYVSAQQIPRDNPCDFCFCFRGDIICLQQSCPPPKLGCVNETIEGFCCPRYECPVQPELSQLLAAAPEPAPTSVAQPAAIAGCEIQGVFYRRGQLVDAASGPCLECRCGADGMMACDPKNCQPQPLLKKMMIAAAQKRRR